jgi:hypothetical protein
MIANCRLQIANCKLRSRLLALIAALAITSVGAPSSAQLPSPEPTPARPVRLRVAWGGGDEARRWMGRISLSDGTLADMQLLGMEADAAAAVWQEGNVIHVDAVRPHRFDGFDVTVQAGGDARLAIELTTPGLAAPVTLDVPIAEAIRQPLRKTLDNKKNVLLVHRSPGDNLQIEADRDALIFAPGEQFTFQFRQRHEELTPGTTVDVVAKLTPARGGAVLWTNSSQRPQRVPVPIRGELAVPITVPLPMEQGVYTVYLSLAHPPGNVPRILTVGGAKPLAERSFQVAVVNPNAEPPAGDPSWQTVLEIDPANPGWWDRLRQRLPVLLRRPLGSTAPETFDHPLGRLVRLPRNADRGEPHWQAYPLPVETTGVPHVLEIEYPADQEQHFGLSVLEPNAAGRAVPIGRDSGVFVEGLGRTEQTQRHMHRFVFWPRTNSPLLLITNLHPNATAQFGTIRVRRRTGPLAGSFEQPPWQQAERLVTAYVGRPLLPETFGASEALDPSSGQSVDDMQTSYEAAQRLAEYLPFAGYNGAVVNVLADGSCIYPSRILLPTPLYDTGRMVAGASDLPRTDSLELILRAFDRRGLALVPAIQFATPLPELERLRRSADPQQSGLEWVGADGQTWLETHGADRGLAPYYNLLDERVQEELLKVVQEVVARYGHHAALAGLAVQLSGDGFAQLPGLAWGFDDATIARFEQETGLRLPSPAGANRFAARQAALSGPHLDLWRAWRAHRVTQFYARAAAIVEAGAPQRRLLLTTEEMFSNAKLRTQLQPNLLTKVRLDRMMFDLGIDREQLATSPAIVLCPAQSIEPTAPLADRAADLEINQAVTAMVGRGDKGAFPAAMFYHPPIRARLSSFDGKGPWESSTWLVSQATADASAARRPYATALGQSDPLIFINGGELLPIGQEDATRHVLRALQQLPAAADAKVYRQQPITVRAYDSADATTLLVVNECPWSADAKLQLELPRESELQRLNSPTENKSTDESLRQKLAAGKQAWSLRLDAYDVAVVRVTSAGVRVADVSATISNAGNAELESQLAALNNRNLTKRSTYDQLANPGFEPASGNPLPGWQFSKGTGLAAELDATMPHGGKTSLYLSSRGPSATVESDPIPTPPTGQLFLTAYLRGENVAPDAELQMVIQTDGPEPFYWKSAPVGPRHPQPLDAQWHPYGFWVRNLPLASQGKMRVKFELDGAGEVWIDDVQLFDLLFPFPDNEYQHSTDEKTELVILLHALKKAHEAGQITDCVRLLESYWPRFLMAYTPPIEDPPAIARQPKPAAAPAVTPAEEKAADAPSGRTWWWPGSWLR